MRAAARSPVRSARRSASRVAAALLLWGLVATLCGCAGLNRFVFRRDEDPFGKKVACRLPPNPTLEQVVDYVNANVDKVHGWRCSNPKINVNRMPLGGNIVVERERRLRLEVTSPLGKEVDFGSNDNIFWMWAKRNEPQGVYYAAHEDLDVARQKMQIPFEPQWLMETLGVAPLSADGMRMEAQEGMAMVKLVKDHTLPNGQKVRRVVVVDTCHGRVLEHSAYDMHGRPLARAVLGTHKFDPRSGAILPHYVKLDWPQGGMSLVLELGDIEVNPTTLPGSMWELPQVPGVPLVNIGGPPRPHQPVVASRSRRDLVAPEAVGVPAAHQTEQRSAQLPADDAEFMPPQVERPVPPPVEIGEPEFYAPETTDAPGRARLSAPPEFAAPQQ